MFSKIRNGLVNNRSNKSKLLMGLVLMALLPIATLVLSGYGFTQYRNVVEIERQGDGLNTLLKREEYGILKFLSGDKNGADIYAEAHNEFLEMKLDLELTSPTHGREVQSIIEGEQRINEQLSTGTAGFFEEFSGAQQGLIEKTTNTSPVYWGIRVGGLTLEATTIREF